MALFSQFLSGPTGRPMTTIAAALVVFAIGVAFSACGKRGAPLPPRERVDQRAEITGFQRGSEVILSWQMPARNASDSSLLNIARIDVYRLAEPLTAPQSIAEVDFASRSIVIASIPIQDSDFGLKTLTYRDTLQFAGQPVRLRYAIRYVNSAGQRAAFSNFFLYEPTARVASVPSELAASVRQDAIHLTWQAPTANIDGSTPANILGYNVYRSGSKTEAAKLLNPEPVIDTNFADQTFEFEKDYFYFVSAISAGTGGTPLESFESAIVTVSPKDTFAPSAPEAITLAATPTTISIFFPANPETDVVGYTIYRSTDPDTPLANWESLTLELLTTTTFLDSRVASGTTYYYYITATDRFKNVSPPSEVINETVP